MRAKPPPSRLSEETEEWLRNRDDKLRALRQQEHDLLNEDFDNQMEIDEEGTKNKSKRVRINDMDTLSIWQKTLNRTLTK